MNLPRVYICLRSHQRVSFCGYPPCFFPIASPPCASHLSVSGWGSRRGASRILRPCLRGTARTTAWSLGHVCLALISGLDCHSPRSRSRARNRGPRSSYTTLIHVAPRVSTRRCTLAQEQRAGVPRSGHKKNRRRGGIRGAKTLVCNDPSLYTLSRPRWPLRMRRRAACLASRGHWPALMVQGITRWQQTTRNRVMAFLQRGVLQIVVLRSPCNTCKGLPRTLQASASRHRCSSAREQGLICSRRQGVMLYSTCTRSRLPWTLVLP